MTPGKKDEDSDSPLFFHIDKSTVLQEARAFNETPINPRKCRLILTRILYLLYQSETFQTQEATETFFSITKLFQSQDIALRQMVYLVIKELANIAENVIIVTQSLSKDVNQKSDVIYRANAIRVLCKITDSSMLQGIERFLKQAIVDKNPSVSSAALVSALHLFNGNKEAVKRWANEVQEAINSKGMITQYHALGLMYQIRQHDRMAVIKLVQNYSRGALRSPLAHCMLIRYACKIMDEEDPSQRSFYDVLEGWLRHKHDMVVYEAARAICNLKDVTAKELFPAVSALQLMLVNHKPTLRFAAIRTLNKLAMTHPTAVFPCNLDMENLITDPNRSIATFAITTLLKTGNEASVDRLMKQITGFMSEISDEFKVIVIDAIRSLCLKFPAKQGLMLNFLSNVLRDEGGYEYKRAIVEAIFDIIHHIPESKEFALSHLCEFIEDCEFTKLAVRILHLLGAEGPKTATPSKYIRYIYNRVILENATVRAAAVSALARFAIELEELRERIQVLLTRCLDDTEDEVRDRAALSLKILADPELCKRYSTNDYTYSWAALERNLVNYLNDEKAHVKAFDISTTPIIMKAEEVAEKTRKKAAAQEMIVPVLKPSTPAGGAGPRAAAPASGADAQAGYAAAMERIPQLAVLGNLFKSSKPVELTESETEYVVTCIKHIFPEHLVFQFDCKNTLNDSLLENLSIVTTIESSDDEDAGSLIQELTIPISKLIYDIPATAYLVLRRPGGVTPTATFSNTMKFLVKDCDPNTGEADEEGFEDEYELEDMDVTMADYVLPSFIVDFKRSWEEIGGDNEIVETYALTNSASIRAAVTQIIDCLGMQPLESTNNVPDRATTHTLLLAGIFIGGVPVVARCRMAFEPSSGVTMELAVRSSDALVGQKIANAIS
ncbi:Coatomer subunit gamma-2 [Rhizophlyctis rosea]|nr:Coatomer subunit gamma-2 [Rhizophlyctis rosea]